MTHRPNLSISLPSLSPTLQGNERSVSSLEKEIMRLQEVLKDREAEISSLEASLKESEQARAPQTPTMESKAMAVNGVNGHVVNGIEDVLLNATLSPRTLNQFDHIRKTMEGNGHAVHPEGSSVASEDDSLERLNELML
jgi:kinesin family protein 4/21/27